MNNASIKKLSIVRETITVLDDDSLVNVNGGTGWFCKGAGLAWKGAKVVYNAVKPIAETIAIGEGTIQAGERVTKALPQGGNGPAPYGSNPQHDTSATGCR